MDDRTAPIPRTGPDATPPTGELRYGRVRVQRLIGRGGMAEVYLGTHEVFGIPVVVKLLPDLRDEDLVERFLREARLAVRLDHPHIVRVFDAGRENGQVFLVMEYIEGQDLQVYAQDRGGRLPIPEALTLIGQAARGLAYAHGEGVVHRDIKPANLIRRAKDQRVKILDFGLARSAGMDQLTSPDRIMGTLPYMPLEQLQGHATSASDVYSLGVSLYQLLTGRFPAMGSLEDLLRYHREGSPPPLSLFRPVPERLDELVRRMVARLPQERPDAKGLVQEIDALLVGMGSPSSAADEATETTRAPGTEMPTSLAADILANVPSRGTGPETVPTHGKLSPARRGTRLGRWVLIVVVLGLAVAAAVKYPSKPQAAPPRWLDVGAAVLIAPPITRGMEGMNKTSVKAAPSVSFVRGEVTQGKGIRFAFHCEEPIHVYVFQVDGAAGVYCLFPDYFVEQHAEAMKSGDVVGVAPSNPLRPGANGCLVPPVVHLKSGKDGVWWFRFDATKGMDWLLLVASREPVMELDQVRERLGRSAAVDPAELKSLAARWQSEAQAGSAPTDLSIDLFEKDGEHALDPGGSFLRGPGKVVWTVELDHR